LLVEPVIDPARLLPDVTGLKGCSYLRFAASIRFRKVDLPEPQKRFVEPDFGYCRLIHLDRRIVASLPIRKDSAKCA